MQAQPHRYFMVHKPYGMTSQFLSAVEEPLLGDLHFPFPGGTHAVGRLDKTSEGLLLLTTNKKITALLFQSPVPHKRTYLVQVKYKVTNEQLQQLQNGVAIRIERGALYTTPPCDVQLIEEPKDILPAIQFKKDYIPTTWLLITLTEGKFRQVRKMVAAIKHNCMRLIRVSIEDLLLVDLLPGEVKEMEEKEFFRLLKLDATSID